MKRPLTAEWISSQWTLAGTDVRAKRSRYELIFSHWSLTILFDSCIWFSGVNRRGITGSSTLPCSTLAWIGCMTEKVILCSTKKVYFKKYLGLEKVTNYPKTTIPMSEFPKVKNQNALLLEPENWNLSIVPFQKFQKNHRNDKNCLKIEIYE